MRPREGDRGARQQALVRPLRGYAFSVPLGRVHETDCACVSTALAVSVHVKDAQQLLPSPLPIFFSTSIDPLADA
jgi:hypothetical protein